VVRVNPVLTESPPYPFAALEARKSALVAAGRTLFDFTVGDPLEPTPRFVRDALIAAIPAVSQYPTVAGRRSLREAVARYLARRFGVTLDPEREVLPCSGAKEAVFHLPLAIIDRASPKRTVVWGEPAYPVYERGAAYAGAELWAAPLEASRGFLLEPDDVPAAVLERTALFWINYPHNPTGAAADRAYLARVAAAARRYGFVVASDETYADVYFLEPPPSLLEFLREGVLVIHSLSKRSGMTGYRSGFLAGDPALVGALRKMRPSVGVASPEFVQAAAEAAWNDDAHAAERRAIFGEKRRKVLALCDRLGLRPLDSGAGLYVWIAVPEGETSLGYCERLLDGGVVLTPGDAFGRSGAGFVRAALVPLASELDAALEAWGRAHERAG
jgi:acetylornithine aminotransferase